MSYQVFVTLEQYPATLAEAYDTARTVEAAVRTALGLGFHTVPVGATSDAFLAYSDGRHVVEHYFSVLGLPEDHPALELSAFGWWLDIATHPGADPRPTAHEAEQLGREIQASFAGLGWETMLVRNLDRRVA